MLLELNGYFKPHSYYVFSTGTKLKNKVFGSRKEAEIYMNNYCNKFNIKVECVEFDKHQRKYSDHNGVRFYINRI